MPMQTKPQSPEEKIATIIRTAESGNGRLGLKALGEIADTITLEMLSRLRQMWDNEGKINAVFKTNEEYMRKLETALLASAREDKDTVTFKLTHRGKRFYLYLYPAMRRLDEFLPKQ